MQLEPEMAGGRIGNWETGTGSTVANLQGQTKTIPEKNINKT